MKTLYLLRHAKSSWKNPALADMDRPLNARGKRDAPQMAALFRDWLSDNSGVVPQSILCSPAKRARRTARAFRRALALPKHCRAVDARLYFQGVDAMLTLLLSLDDTVESVLLVAHNPDLTGLQNRLSDAPIDWLPTAALVGLRSSAAHWQDLLEQPLEQFYSVYPKQQLLNQQRSPG